jgi:hypothetical protein
MPNKIDELFAPEQLRRNWQKTKKRAAMPVATEKESNSPPDIFALLQILIKGRFFGDDAVVLNLLLEELHTLLISVFPPIGDNQTPAENQAEIIAAIQDVLNRIEDIIEAFETAGRGQLRK